MVPGRVAERGSGRPAVPIIALTAGAFAAERERCAAVGMSGFIAKPVTLSELYEALAQHGGDLAELAAG